MKQVIVGGINTNLPVTPTPVYNELMGGNAAERKVSEDSRSLKIASIDAEIEKNTSMITAIRGVLVSGKIFTYGSLADADVKTITDLTQRNYSLAQEKVKIQVEKEAEDKSYNVRYADINTAIQNLTNDIAAIREAVEIV